MSMDDGTPEVFNASWAQTWRNALRPTLPTTILVVLISWVIGYIVGGVAGSLLLPVALVGLIVLIARLGTTRHRVRVSPQGIEVIGPKQHAGIRWANIDRVAVLKGRRPRTITVGDGAEAVATLSAAGIALANTGAGLVGLGFASKPASPLPDPTWLLTDAQPVQVSLFLTVVDRNWQRGPIGAWLRRYRPDLG